MKKFLKYFMLAAGGCAVFLIALVAYVAATFNPNDYKPQIVQLVERKLNRTLKINGDIKLTFYPAIGADLGGLSLSEPASENEFAAVDSARVALQLVPLLSRQIVVSRIEAHGLRANLVKRSNGTSNWTDLGGSDTGKAKQSAGGDGDEGRAAQQPFQFNIDHVLLDNASLSYTDEASGAKYTLNKLGLKTGKIAAETPTDIELAMTIVASHPRVNADVRIRTRLAFSFAGKSFKVEALDMGVKGDAFDINLVALDITGSAEGNAQSIESSEIALDVDAKQGGRTIKGKLVSPLAVDLDAQTYDLNKLVASLALSDENSAHGPMTIKVTGKAHADMAKQRASLNFSSTLDESTVTGTVGLAHFSPPSYVFDVNVDKLDADRYVGAKRPEGQGDGSGKGAPSAEENSLDFSALKTLTGKGSVRIGSLKLANLKVQKVRLDLMAGGGRLDVKPLSAALYQGTMNGSVSLIATTPPQVSLRQRLTAVSLGPFLKDAIGKDLLEGKGNVMLDVSGQGVAVSAIKKTLNGSASLSLADGALKGINIGETIRSAKARLGSLRGESTQVANAAEKTDFTELKASFAIKDGVAHNSDLSLKSPLLRLGGKGDIDIGADRIDYLAMATLVATAAGQGGKNADELAGVTVPVRISGPFDSLSYKLDFNALISGLVQQRIDEKKKELKTKVQDKLNDQLKRLFGR